MIFCSDIIIIIIDQIRDLKVQYIVGFCLFNIFSAS